MQNIPNEIREDMLKVKRMVSEVEIILGKREGETELVNKLIDAENLLTYCMSRLENAIVPPCKEGDTVYVLTSDSITGFEKSRVKRMLLTNLQDGMTIKIIIPCVCDDWGGAVREFYPEDFGKTVFLTREEAERALEART